MPPEREPHSRFPRAGRQRLRHFGLAGLLIGLALLATPAGARARENETRREPTDPQRRAQRLESAYRDAWLQPDQVVATLGLAPGDVVADIGSGPGYFTLRFAREVGATGRVYGVEIEPYFLTELERLARESGLANVVPILTEPDVPGLPPGCCDLAFFSSSYHHIRDRVGYLRELQTSLKPGGRVAIIGMRPFTPPPDADERPSQERNPRRNKGLDPEQVVRELREAGFTLLERPDFLEGHYFVIARVPR